MHPERGDPGLPVRPIGDDVVAHPVKSSCGLSGMACMDDDEATSPIASTAPQTQPASQKTGLSAPVTAMGWLLYQ